MYLINSKQKKLEKIPQTVFKQAGIKERKDLQEFLVQNPEVFGEELLIIQKEFDGFDKTKERLDILALDKQGNLVVIENKLDDSGRDVVWQVLKYASYCAGLKAQQIKEIFSRYLQKYSHNEKADELLAEFFEYRDFEEGLNQSTTQRIIMVSGNFRPEVTSTALWLNRCGLRIQCFRASVYKLKNQLLFNLSQIIPTKDTSEYEITIADKNQEEVNNQEKLKNRHIKRLEFWSQFLEFMNSKNQICSGNSPSKDSWIGIGLGMSGVNLNAVISQEYARVELYINRGTVKENKKIFDRFFARKSAIEKSFGSKLSWERMDDKVTSRVKNEIKSVDAFNKEDWQKINRFLSENIIRFKEVFLPEVQRIRN